MGRQYGFIQFDLTQSLRAAGEIVISQKSHDRFAIHIPVKQVEDFIQPQDID